MHLSGRNKHPAIHTNPLLGILHHFDLHAADKFPEETTITREMCASWIYLKPDEHPNGLLRRVTPVRQLGKYMNGLGCDAYVILGHVPDKQVKYEAHIYTDAELKTFFNVIDLNIMVRRSRQSGVAGATIPD